VVTWNTSLEWDTMLAVWLHSWNGSHYLAKSLTEVPKKGWGTYYCHSLVQLSSSISRAFEQQEEQSNTYRHLKFIQPVLLGSQALMTPGLPSEISQVVIYQMFCHAIPSNTHFVSLRCGCLGHS
jgi:hypothetical protein